MSDATNEQALTATPYHPEEIKAVFEMRMGNTLSFQATARCTPAGVITAGIAATAVLLAVGALIRACRS